MKLILPTMTNTSSFHLLVVGPLQRVASTKIENIRNYSTRAQRAPKSRGVSSARLGPWSSLLPKLWLPLLSYHDSDGFQQGFLLNSKYLACVLLSSLLSPFFSTLICQRNTPIFFQLLIREETKGRQNVQRPRGRTQSGPSECEVKPLSKS